MKWYQRLWTYLFVKYIISLSGWLNASASAPEMNACPKISLLDKFSLRHGRIAWIIPTFLHKKHIKDWCTADKSKKIGQDVVALSKGKTYNSPRLAFNDYFWKEGWMIQDEKVTSWICGIQRFPHRWLNCCDINVELAELITLSLLAVFVCVLCLLAVDDLEGHSSLRKLRPSTMCHAERLIAEFPHQGAKSIIISFPQICAAESQGWRSEEMRGRGDGDDPGCRHDAPGDGRQTWRTYAEIWRRPLRMSSFSYFIKMK